MNEEGTKEGWFSGLEWRIAWRHVRAGATRPPWLRYVNLACIFMLLIGLSLAAYGGTLGPDTLEGEQIFGDSAVTPSQQIVGVLAGVTIAIATIVGVFAALARYFNILATIITLSVMAGCMQLVTVLSLMSGLEIDLRDKILNQKAHIRISGVDGNRFTDYETIVAAVEGARGVAGASPYLEDEIMIRSGLNRQGAVVLGIQPDRLESVSNVRGIIQEGSYDHLNRPERIPAFDPFALGRGDTPWRLRHLDKGRTAAEQGKNPAPRATPEHLKIGAKLGVDRTKHLTAFEDEAGTGTESGTEIDSSAPDEVRMGLHSRPTPIGEGRGTRIVSRLRDIPGLPVSGPTSGVLGRRGDRPTGKTLGLGHRPESAEDSDWEDPVEQLGLGPALPDVGPAAPEEQDEGLSDNDDDRTAGGAPVIDPVLIGRELAMELAVNVGARVQLITPVGRMTPAGRVPGQLATRVAGVFYSGMYEYDRKNVYLPLATAQAFLRTGDRITGIEVKLDDIEKLDEGKNTVVEVLRAQGRDGELVVETWEDLNRNLFAAMFLEKIAMFVALLFVILVASFGILASNLMSVLEKAKEIAIMKAMGAQDLLIRRVFVAEGLGLGLVGASGGIGMGLALCWALDRYGFPLNENVYYIEKLPVVVDPWEVLLVGVAAMLIVWASSLYPARIASKMRPAEGLRHSE